MTPATRLDSVVVAMIEFGPVTRFWFAAQTIPPTLKDDPKTN